MIDPDSCLVMAKVAMQGVDMKNRKAMQEALKNVKGVKVETEKTIKVEMK